MSGFTQTAGYSIIIMTHATLEAARTHKPPRKVIKSSSTPVKKSWAGPIQAQTEDTNTGLNLHACTPRCFQERVLRSGELCGKHPRTPLKDTFANNTSSSSRTLDSLRKLFRVAAGRMFSFCSSVETEADCEPYLHYGSRHIIP